MSYFFTSDEHYGHANIIKYTNRPFASVEEMDEHLILQHNAVVGLKDTVVHAGDFCWGGWAEAEAYQKRLNGSHIFLKGSHDKWLKHQEHHEIWEASFNDVYLVVCHYPMVVWPRSHYNSIQCYGHTHKDLELPGKRIHIGVDGNGFTPLSLDEIRRKADELGDNPNLVRR